jgi:N-acetylmuramoyl-L-alanine amidase
MAEPRRLLIWLDPGHGTLKRDGARDTGAADTSGLGSGLYEKDLVLAAAQGARDLLTAQGHEVRLTHQRSDYSEVMNYSERGAMAAATEYDCYVSLHLDSASNPSARGTTVFVPKLPVYCPRSRALATALAAALRGEFGTPVSYAAARPSGVMPHWHNLGTFVGGGNAYSPGALALPEPLFMSNREDMEIIRRDDFSDRYAQAVCRGILGYAGSAEAEPTETPWQQELRAAATWARSSGISDATRLGSPLTRGEYLVMRYRERGVSGS